MAKRRPGRRVVRWLDRAVVGAFMAAAAFVVERVVIRHTRTKRRTSTSG
jgi:hypothetical protein